MATESQLSKIQSFLAHFGSKHLSMWLVYYLLVWSKWMLVLCKEERLKQTCLFAQQSPIWQPSAQPCVKRTPSVTRNLKGIARMWLLQSRMLKTQFYWLAAVTSSRITLIFIYKVCNATFNLNAINFEIISENWQKGESTDLPEKGQKCHYQIYISTKVNIHCSVDTL